MVDQEFLRSIVCAENEFMDAYILGHNLLHYPANFVSWKTHATTIYHMVNRQHSMTHDLSNCQFSDLNYGAHIAQSKFSLELGICTWHFHYVNNLNRWFSSQYHLKNVHSRWDWTRYVEVIYSIWSYSRYSCFIILICMTFSCRSMDPL